MIESNENNMDLPENEFLKWIGEGWLKRCRGGNYGDHCLPDKEIMYEIKALCIQKKQVLQVPD